MAMPKETELKARVSRKSVTALARHLRAYAPTFPSRRFVTRACEGLEELELKARIGQVADVLATCLPSPFPKAASVIEGANQQQEGDREDDAQPEGEAAEGFFIHWPVATFIERYGLEHFDAAFAAMHSQTRLASCEFAVRPFIEREQKRTFAVLERWVDDSDHHVRRLVSEGTRPRLPWGRRLRALQSDPSPSIALLDRLCADDQLYVRRSVANHLNDISKDDCDLAVSVARRWKHNAPAGRERDAEWVIRHALRGLLKSGHAGALELQGFAPPRVELSSFCVSPRELSFGGSLRLHLDIKATSGGDWMIDYVVHRVLANGQLAPKVFKWTQRTVAPGDRVQLDKAHAIRAISTRKYYDGVHRCELRINGRSLASVDFTLTGTNRSLESTQTVDTK